MEPLLDRGIPTPSAGLGQARQAGAHFKAAFEARIAFGGVAHKPWRATRAEASLRDAPATEDAFLRAADEELAGARPLAGNRFKVPLLRNTLTLVLRELVQGHTR